MISNRTKAFLIRYLLLHDVGYVTTLLGGHNIALDNALGSIFEWNAYSIGLLREIINVSDDQDLMSLVNEMHRTTGMLASRVIPEENHYTGWRELSSCLFLDGYAPEADGFISIEPAINTVQPVEDEFHRELDRSGLACISEIKNSLENSVENFRRTPPDYNGCLANARIAIETLVKTMAQNRTTSQTFTGWGTPLAFLRAEGVISEREEQALSGVYSFVSDGAHRAVGLDEKEMARLGRNLIASMCYFLIKVHNN